MKKYRSLCLGFFFISFVLHASPPPPISNVNPSNPDVNASTTNVTTNNTNGTTGSTANPSTSQERIKQFLARETPNLSPAFPYRINVFTQGQIAKNTAGIRIAETAKQIFADTSGLVFYYELYNNSMRVPHWHANAVETGTVTDGKMRITIWQGAGQRSIFTVEKDGTWVIPQAALHALENVGEGQLTFLVAYNSPVAADRDFATAWAALPSSFLERTLGLTADEIATVKKSTNNRLSSFDPSASYEKADISSPYSNNFAAVQPLYNSELGSIRRINGTTNATMQAMTLQQTILKPGTMRVPHWYTTGDALLFVYKGDAFFTMMDNDGKVFTALVKRGDLIALPVGTFHTYLNIGQDDLVIYESFNTGKEITEINLLNGTQNFSAGTIAGATGLSKESTNKVMNQQPQTYMIAY